MNYNPFSLEGKTILVTGASSGIGKATAIECSKMGAKLIISARNQARLQETLEALEGDGHRMIIADLTDKEQMEQLVANADVLDGVVLGAGITVSVPFPFSTIEKYKHIFDTNFFALVETMRLLVKKKKLKKRASIVIISSIGGVYTFTPGQSAYGASKAALHSVMQNVSNEFKPKGIRVNTVNPGMVETPLIHGDVVTQEQMDEDAKHYLYGRYGEPEEIAYGIVYLLSDAALWITGHALVIDGGISVSL